jgi:transketolase
MRQRAADTLVDLFVEDERVALVLADISLDLLEPALRHDPLRAVNVGIMEQAAVGVAAGFALEGFHPVVHTIAPFLAERPLEQVKLDFGYQGLGGLFVTTGASYDYSEYGLTHHAPGDVAALSTVPNVEVLVPGAPDEVEALIRAAYANGQPTYLRTSLALNAHAHALAPGGLTLVRRGADLTVIAVGPFLDRTLAALDGLDATVLYATTAFPLDAATLAAEAAPAADVVVVEPLYEGTSTAQVAAALSHRPTRIHAIGIPRRVFSRYGSPEQHDEALGLDTRGIRERLLALVARRQDAAA